MTKNIPLILVRYKDGLEMSKKKAASVGKSVVKKAVVQDFWTVLQLMSVLVLVSPSP